MILTNKRLTQEFADLGIVPSASHAEHLGKKGMLGLPSLIHFVIGLMYCYFRIFSTLETAQSQSALWQAQCVIAKEFLQLWEKYEVKAVSIFNFVKI